MINNNPKFLSGQMFIILIILLAVITIFTTAIYSGIGQFTLTTRNSYVADQATTLADSGIDLVLNKLSDPQYSGNETITSPQTGDIIIAPLQSAEYADTRSVTSTGCVPDCSSPFATKRKVTVQIAKEAKEISFPYTIHGTQTSGTPITLFSTGITGNVHSNGAITCALSGATSIEFVIPPTTCAGATQVANQPLGPMTTQDIQDWRLAAQNGNTPITCTTPCNLNSSITIGPRKYIGNVNIADNAQVALVGPIWITGDLAVTAISTIPRLYINPSLGSCGTVIVVDGRVSFGSAINVEDSGSSPLKGYPLIVTEYTGASDAIRLSGTGGSTLEGIFYATAGRLSTSGVTTITGAVVSNTLALTINTFTGGTANNLQPARFCGLSTNWVVKRGTYKLSK